jgi:DNA mismatch repair protein MutS2
MPEPIVRQAEGMLSGEELRAEDMLTDLHNLRIQEARARDAAREKQREVESLRQELRERLSGIQREREEILRQAESSAEAEVDALRDELRSLRTRILLNPQEDVSRSLQDAEEELEKVETRVSRPEPLVEETAKAERTSSGEPEPGDSVRLLSLGFEGTVLEIDDDEVVVQAGAIRTRVPKGDVTLLQQEPEPASSGISVPQRPASPGVQIDLRGQTVDEALRALERYLDEAAMAALPWVRVVHGKGTGKLRREVRRYMSTHPLVTSYEAAPLNEGGDGATVARLVSTG